MLRARLQPNLVLALLTSRAGGQDCAAWGKTEWWKYARFKQPVVNRRRDEQRHGVLEVFFALRIGLHGAHRCQYDCPDGM